MIDTKSIENLKKEVSKQFSDQQKTDGILTDTMDLVRKENNRYIIKDEQSYVLACELQKIVHELDKKVVAHHKPMKQAADAVKKVILDAEKKARENLTSAKGILAAAIGGWLRKKEEEAKEKARKERERIEAERLKKAEEMEKKAQELKEQGTPEAMAAAINLDTKVEDILDAELPTIKIEKPQKVSGMKTVDYWKFEIVNPAEIPREYLIPDEKKIGQVVRAMKDKTKIPGVRIWVETKSSVTGK